MPDDPSFFDGIAEDDLRSILERLDRRAFEAGETILLEGDAPSELYVIDEGIASVLITDGRGREHQINRVGPGGSLGEMSVFSGRPVSATVRAATDVTVRVLTGDDVRRLGSLHPRLYENLGAMLSARLAEADRRYVKENRARTTLVEAAGGPPLAAYALACSVAWHSVEPTLLVLGPGAQPDAALAALADTEPPDDTLLPRAYVGDASAVRPEFKHVLVLQGDGGPAPRADRTLRLVPAHDGGSRGRANYAIRAFVDGAEPGNRPSTGLVDLPPLDAADAAALREGVLPLSTPAGRAFGAVARNVADLEVGVALGGGAVRGWAHVGALQRLTAAGVPIDYIAGTSVGAVVASGFSVGMSFDEIADAIQYGASRLFRVRLPRGALLSPNGFRAVLQELYGDMLMHETRVPIAVTATDVFAHREVVLRDGLLWQAVLASTALPGIFPPQVIGEHVLVDGGVLNPVPSNVVAEMGAAIQIGVKLTRRPAAAKREHHRARLSLIDMVTSTFELMQSKISTEAAGLSTVLVEPTFDNSSGFGLRSFADGRQFIPHGLDAVDAALPRIATALPWLRRTPAMADARA